VSCRSGHSDLLFLGIPGMRGLRWCSRPLRRCCTTS
jgi:hypothetical protein